MFNSEQEFQNWLIKLPKVHWTHIDPKMHGTGFPDLSYCFDSMEGHIELKWKPGIRSTQASWFRNRVAHGGRPMLWWSPGTEDMIYVFSGKTVVQHLISTSGPMTWRKLSDGQISLDETRMASDVEGDLYFYLRYPVAPNARHQG